MADDGRIRVPVNGETIGEAFDKAGEDISGKLDDMGKGINELFETGVENAQQFGSDVENFFKNGAEAVGDFLSETAERNKAESEKVMEQHDPYIRPMELS